MSRETEWVGSFPFFCCCEWQERPFLRPYKGCAVGSVGKQNKKTWTAIKGGSGRTTSHPSPWPREILDRIQASVSNLTGHSIDIQTEKMSTFT